MKNVFLLSLTALLIFAGCSKDSGKGALKGELRIAGGTAHLNVEKEIAERLMRENPGLKISIAAGGSGVGIKQVGEGIIDIGNSGRDLKETEISAYGLVPHPMAIDGIAVIVHPSSKINGLTAEQARDIFTGKITSWKVIGGDDSRVNVYTRDAESGTKKTFVNLLLEKDNNIVKSANFVKSNGEMKTAVSNDKSAIGYVSVGYLDSTVKALPVDGVEPTVENIKNRKYRIQRFLYMVTKGEPAGNIKAFIDAVLSDSGQNIVARNHFIPVK